MIGAIIWLWWGNKAGQKLATRKSISSKSQAQRWWHISICSAVGVVPSICTNKPAWLPSSPRPLSTSPTAKPKP